MCPVCRAPLVGQFCTNCGARVSADGSWAYNPNAARERGDLLSQAASVPAQGAAPQYVSPAQGVYPDMHPPGFTPQVAPAGRARRGRRLGIAAVLAVLVLGIVAGVALARHMTNTTASGPTVTPTVTRKDYGPRVALSGTLLAQLSHVRPVGPLKGSTRMEAEVALRVRDGNALQSFIKSAYDPNSAQSEHFLTPQEFKARFAPTDADRMDVSNWLRLQGLTVTDDAANGLLLIARGSARQMNKAFGTSIDTYSDASGFTFYANSTEIKVPNALKGTILDVDGLNNIGHVSPRAGPLRAFPRPARGSHPGYTPKDLLSAYSITSLRNGGLDGTGQTIALAEWGDFAQSDINTYDSEYGISAPAPERISVPFNGQVARPGPGQEEVELDIEVLHAIAPKAHVLVYVSPQTNGAGLAQANRMVSDDRASLVSVSWGFPDIIAPSGVLNAVNQTLAEAAAQGQGILVASGDAGAFDYGGAPHTPVVDFPSSDPFVTAVGGTALYTTGSGGYNRESVWGSRSDASGSGGGLSLYFRRPWYQTGPGVKNSHSNGARQTPDVAAVADPNTGYSVYVTENGKTGWGEFGGTSASTPLWAAYMSLVQQKLGHKLGFLNPLLYHLAQSQSGANTPFHDVTQGDNLYYTATPGWDYGTGWGSMNGAAMLDEVVRQEGKK